MKRLTIRLSIIGVLIASGVLAIAQAQRGEGDTPEPVAANVGLDASAAAGASVGDSNSLPPSQPQPLLDNAALAPMGVTPGYGPDPTPQDDFGGPPRATTESQALADVTQPPMNTLSAPPLDVDLPPVNDLPPAGDLPPVNVPTGGYSDLPPVPGGSAGASLSDLPPAPLAEPNVVQPREPAAQSLTDLPPNDPQPTDPESSGLPPTDLPPTGLPPMDAAPAVVTNQGPSESSDPQGLPSPPNEALAGGSVQGAPAYGSLGDGGANAEAEMAGGTGGSLAPITPQEDAPPAGSFAANPVAPGPTSLPPNNFAPITGGPGSMAAEPSVTQAGTAGGSNPAAPYGAPYGQPSGAGAAAIADASVGQGSIGGPLAAGAAGSMGASLAGNASAAGDSPNEYQPIGSVAPASAAQASATIEAAPVPGDRQLEGQQTPFVAIEKRAPQEIRVGQPATFEIVVRNAGQVTAQDVTVIDQVPKGTQFMDATPAPQQLPNGTLIWSFGAVAPGQDKLVTLRLMPQQEGEIGSVAKVVCQAQASVRTNCTKPLLAVRQTAPEQVLIGDEVEVLIEISNPGTGAADDVVLEADIPPGLLHRKGREIDYSIGTLQPNESRTVRLQLAADQAGVVQQSIRARSGNLEKKSSVGIEVIAPTLQMKIYGPAKRYIRREASFELELANPGTATARDIQAVVYLPQGLEFKTASHQGRYNPQNHAVFWRLAELPKGQSGKVQLTALPVAAGEQALRAESRGSLNTSSNTEHTLSVESLNELVFTVSDVNDPIEVGSETTYEIRVTNNGSKTDTNVEVVAQMPEGMQLVKADGPTEHQAEGAVIAFTPLARLAPNGDAIYRLAVKGATPGDHRLRVQIRSQESPAAVIKEEVTRVYQDR